MLREAGAGVACGGGGEVDYVSCMLNYGMRDLASEVLQGKEH